MHDDGRLDASSGALARVREALDPAVIQAASTEAPLRPALTRAHLDGWSMTSLDTHPGRPLVAPWLRGWVDDKPQTRIVWRALLPLPTDVETEKGVLALSRGEKARLQSFLEEAGPHLTETLEAPTYRVVEVLKKRATAWAKTDGQGPLWMLITGDKQSDLDAFALPERLQDKRFDLERAISGRTIVVDARLGGLDHDGLLDAGIAQAPVTLDAPAVSAAGDLQTWEDELLKAAAFRLVTRRLEEQDPSWPEVFAWSRQLDGEEPNLVVQAWRGDGAGGERPSIAKHAQRLTDHLDWTAADAARLADTLALGPEHAAMLVAAARVHDLGKDRRAWQDAVGARLNGRPYAKTRGGFSGDLGGYRHEFGSLHDAAETLGALGDLADLACHIVATHHGHARPTIPPTDPDRPPSASAALAREVALRYARLQARWGPWGLAWWESVLRAADWSASRDLNENGPDARGAHG